MNKTQALQRLKSLGTAQNRKIYARHGVDGPTFGVSYANFGKLKKEIKVDQALAEALWASGNHDARVLATMIADPEKVTGKLLDGWVKDLKSYPLTNAFSSIAWRSDAGRARMGKWMKAKGEWVGSAGWEILTALAMYTDDLDEDFVEDRIAAIERDIHGAKNRARYAMLNALIAMGTVDRGSERRALAAAKRIGAVDVDHGETGCKTPDALSYIPEAAAHRRKKAAKKKAKKSTKAKKTAKKRTKTRA